MQDSYRQSDDSDDDKTDELPVLSEAAIVARGGQTSALGDTLDHEATGEYKVDFSGQRRRTDLAPSHDSIALAAVQQALAMARKELAQSRHEQADLAATLELREQQIAELRASLKQYEQRQSSLQSQLATAQKELANQRRLAAASAAADHAQPYRDEIQSLTAYIAGSRERWKEMEILVSAQGERIADLQSEIEQRIARQKIIEQAAHEESVRADELKTKLAEAVATLRVRERDLALLKRVKPGERVRAAPDATAKLAQLQSQLAERERQLQVANEDRENLNRRLVEAETTLTRTRTDVGRLEKRLVEKDRAVERQDDRIAALQLELGERLAALRKFQGSEAVVADAPAKAALGAKRRAADPAVATGQLPVLVCLTSDCPERHVISEPEMTIGRGADCAIRVLTHFVSREHARLRRDKGKVTIEDCGSTNGVFVNSVRVDRHELEHGDWVTIGETQFRFLHDGAV